MGLAMVTVRAPLYRVTVREHRRLAHGTARGASRTGRSKISNVGFTFWPFIYFLFFFLLKWGMVVWCHKWYQQKNEWRMKKNEWMMWHKKIDWEWEMVVWWHKCCQPPYEESMLFIKNNTTPQNFVSVVRAVRTHSGSVITLIGSYRTRIASLFYSDVKYICMVCFKKQKYFAWEKK